MKHFDILAERYLQNLNKLIKIVLEKRLKRIVFESDIADAKTIKRGDELPLELYYKNSKIGIIEFEFGAQNGYSLVFYPE